MNVLQLPSVDNPPVKNVANNNVLLQVQHEWEDFRRANKMSQANAARLLGMNQSAFSQYLRGPSHGGVELNANFLMKFASLTNTDPKKYGLITVDESFRPRTVSVPLVATLSGRKPPVETVVMDSVVPAGNCKAIYYDIWGGPYRRGTVLIIDFDGPIYDHDIAVEWDGSSPQAKIGATEYTLEDGWSLMPLPGSVNMLSEVINDDAHIHPVVSITLFDREGHRQLR